ncbi:hypothetical protein FXO38_13241 [Capsicum annuum]|uniref:Uncharacterized protein n=1 Tax=Capsicum annuum TaxID=4072 RepID=A0A2G2YYX5_CAPAN|nr:hypothetical protein FXO38_13241 [Capsicum annuum]PHT74948.1 hypothetical protein T459_22225 [Capsicum annuum]
MLIHTWFMPMHQNSTCGAAENVGTAAKPNGIMYEPIRADRPNAFSNNNSSILSCIQVAVDIPSQIEGPSTFELPDHALIGPGREVKESNWLGATTSTAGIILDWNLGAFFYGFKLLKSRVVVLFVAGTSQSTVIRLREGFRRKDQNSSTSSSEGCGSSVKRSRSADVGHLGNATVPCTGDGSTWTNIEGINSDKRIDSRRPILALHSSSYRSVLQEPEVRSSYVDRNLEHNSSLVICSSSGLESQGGDSSTSTSANQQILDLNLALAF